jgi:NhaA family Na+:H+ antiporter
VTNLPIRDPLVAAPIHRITRPLLRFLRVESASGLALMACTAIALAAANSPIGPAWESFWRTPLSIGVGGSTLSHPLWYWVNDGLMTVFFFVIGLELKRERVAGELRDPKGIVLPLAAAAGGAAVPAIVCAARRSCADGRRRPAGRSRWRRTSPSSSDASRSSGSACRTACGS